MRKRSTAFCDTGRGGLIHDCGLGVGAIGRLGTGRGKGRGLRRKFARCGRQLRPRNQIGRRNAPNGLRICCFHGVGDARENGAILLWGALNGDAEPAALASLKDDVGEAALRGECGDGSGGYLIANPDWGLRSRRVSASRAMGASVAAAIVAQPRPWLRMTRTDVATDVVA